MKRREKSEVEKQIEENVAWQMKEGEEAERIRREEELAWEKYEREKKKNRREA